MGRRGQQHRQRAGPGRCRTHRGVGRVVLGEVVDDPQQPGGVLRPLGVPAQPEEILGHPGGEPRQDGVRGQRGDRVRDPRDGPGARVHPQGAEHPDVLRQRPLRARDDPGARAPGDPAEPAGHHPVGLAGGDGEGSQHEAAGLQAERGDHGRGAHRHRLLSAPDGGIGLDQVQQPAPLVLGQLGAEDAAAAQAASGAPPERSDHQRVQVRPDVSPGALVTAPVRRHGPEDRLPAEQRPPGGREEGHQRGVLQHAGADRVDHGHGAPPGRLEQTGRAEVRVRPQFEGIGERLVDPAQDDVHGLHPVHRTHPHPAAAHREVAALDQGVAEQGGQERLVEGGLRTGARGEQHDLGRLRGRRRRLLQRVADDVEEVAQPFQLGVAVQARHDPGDDPPVLHHVPGAGGGLGPVAEHQPVAVRGADQVGGGQEEPPRAVGGQPVRRPDESGVAEHDVGGDHSGLDQPARPVQVAQDGVQEFGPLLQAGRQRAPLGGVEDHGERVEGPAAAGPPPARHAVGDAVVLDQPAGLGPAREQPGRAEQVDAGAEVVGGLADRAVPAGELVDARTGGGGGDVSRDDAVRRRLRAGRLGGLGGLRAHRVIVIGTRCPRGADRGCTGTRRRRGRTGPRARASRRRPRDRGCARRW